MDQFFPVVYDKLRRIAARQLRLERPGHTLSTTALVHEAWLELAKFDRLQWKNRPHFLAVAAQVMRRVLIDYAVSRRAQTRGNGQRLVPFLWRHERRGDSGSSRQMLAAPTLNGPPVNWPT